MKLLLPLAATGEILTGAALIISPSLVCRLLLGAEPIGIANPIAHVLGIALMALGIACWPGSPLTGMLTYGGLTALYLLFLGIQGQWVGPLLWTGVALHALLTLLLAISWLTRPAAHAATQSKT